jgi:RecG-like helicase
MQIAIQTRRRNLEKNARALPCAGDNRLIKPFLAALGFDLTPAQTKVLRAIRHDMAGPTRCAACSRATSVPAKPSWPPAPP